MNLLINGMDMPELGENAERLWVPCWIEVDEDGKAIFCTGTHFDPNTIRSYSIEEVSTPHGRLIDADALTKALEKRWNVDDDQDFANKSVWRELESAPTIIEAEE